MNKLILTSGVAAVLLSACTTTPQDKEPMIGMANPASEFCIKQGGKLEVRKDKGGGEYAMCHLPNGQVVEEWDYFRQHHQ